MLTPEQRLENKRASRRKYYYKNREKQLATSKLYYKENREKQLANADARRKSAQFKTYVFVSEMARMSKSRANQSNIPYTLTQEDIKGLLIASNGICAISGLRMDTILHSQVKASIDRIDSSKGYVMGNVQIVAGCVNRAKNVLSQKDFIALCKAIAKANV